MTIEAIHQNAENLFQIATRLSSLIKQKKAIISIIQSTKNKNEINKSRLELKKIDSELSKIKPYLKNSAMNIDKLCKEELNKNV